MDSSSSSQQQQQPSFSPNPLVPQAILLLALFNEPISSRILQANAFMKIFYSLFLLCHRIFTISLLLYASTKLFVYVVSSLAFAAGYDAKHRDGRQPDRWTAREMAASLHWMIAFALSSAAWSRPSGSSSIWGTLEEIIAVLPFALCAPPVTIQMLSILAYAVRTYLWSRDRAKQNNISRPLPFPTFEYVLTTVLSIVAIIMAVAVARMDSVYNREGPGYFRNLCAILSVILKVFAWSHFDRTIVCLLFPYSRLGSWAEGGSSTGTKCYSDQFVRDVSTLKKYLICTKRHGFPFFQPKQYMTSILFLMATRLHYTPLA
ncbi:uncharacterized protein EV420DRAFT_557406 [Desarmillaria tabescens]|uniref:Uncharacterized protein n=1 Tax=Armillaria tabescens TaxID=1929756 RepID=A0AA39K949_ARMTA|nr:uncharacterized protein EV420DRAFT_557406 [Desarmillaria tabescens]KAK0455715.1 hypothetical protein EV420DRAFT_557406 [Desarmillaria tabescens]